MVFAVLSTEYILKVAYVYVSKQFHLDTLYLKCQTIRDSS